MFGLRIFFFVCLSFFLLSGASAAPYSISTNASEKDVHSRKMLLWDILTSRSWDFSYSSLRIFIDAYLYEPRGRMKGSAITLSNKVLKDGEFAKLFVHEFAHFLDVSILTSRSRRIPDPSLDFYRISWQSPTVKYPSENLSAFVSGYAATNQYEDFAESLTFYVFHNTTFYDRALKNESLRKKYLFLQNQVFSQGEFVDTDFSIGMLPNYVWDTTKISISLQKYLYFLKESI